MKNLKLFPKTFLHCLGLMSGVTLIAFLLIYSLFPTVYQMYKQRELDADAARLAGELQELDSKELSAAITSYAISKGYGYTARYEGGEVICSAGVGISFEMLGGDFGTGNGGGSVRLDVDFATSETSFRTVDGKTVDLTLRASLQPIGDAGSVLLLLLPAVLILCVMLSAFVSYFYARSIVKPIQGIADATVRMRSLAPDISCSIDRNDEIGMLSQNIDAMYQKLLAAISDLELQIQTASRSEREKLDFLLLASHELKTPVTAVRGMVDGMLYRVGAYKDRDAYLAKCQKSLESLSELLCRMLEASKLDANAAAKDKERTEIGRLLAETASPYFIIAESRGVAMRLSLEGNFSACVSAELVKKAISNVISNAVKYTDAGKSIRIYLEGRAAVVENECLPFTQEELSHIGEPFYQRKEGSPDRAGGRTGLGLYLTERILHACRLSYSFAPYENGMRFVLDFGEEESF